MTNTRPSRRPEVDRLHLLSSVMGFGGFRFGQFFRWFLIRLDPFGVENAGLIDALVSVRAEEIALRLQEVCRQPSGTITIEISQ